VTPFTTDSGGHPDVGFEGGSDQTGRVTFQIVHREAGVTGEAGAIAMQLSGFSEDLPHLLGCRAAQ
jgi:hypothetical protein